MTFVSFFANRDRVVIDRDAGKRDNQTIPSEVVIRHVSADTLAHLLDAARQTDNMPAVIVGESGKIVVMTAGGSGVVWLQGAVETPSQHQAMKLVYEAFGALGVKVSKRRRKPVPAFVEDDDTPTVVS
jgi:hypothetical protein